MALTVAAALTASARAGNVTAVDVAPVWSGHPVGFALFTAGDRQAVGYYDTDRRLTVAVRSLGEPAWATVPLPRTTGWDSHNSVAMAVDADGFVHLAADMHSSPLVYFRSRHPLDEPFTAGSFELLDHMTGDREERMTYPTFLHDEAGDLVFMYRHGSSGNGDQILNRYDTRRRRWQRLLDQPLTSGRLGSETMNAYFHGPVLGPDGFFHLVWVWRDTPDCGTCHDVCYARSRDLVHWERSDGASLELPITAATCEVVDPVPPGGGLLNGLVRIGFDTRHRPIVSYHKYDDAGRSQIHAARRENGHWRIHKTSDWHHRWEFGGGGSIEFEVGLGPVAVAKDGTLVQEFSSAAGSGTWRLDPESLVAIGPAVRPSGGPDAFAQVESPWPGMQVQWRNDGGASAQAGRFMLRWETLGPNRDRPRPGPLPPPTMLRVIDVAE